jgi:hypothetical protein
MSGWLDPVRAALDAAPGPVRFFVRDDDAGWSNDRLLHLLDLLAERSLPVDLAVIPSELTTDIASRLVARAEAAPRGRIGFHQHGFAHRNHESEGRKCEFGPSRTRSAQGKDIERGWRRLGELLGPLVDPIFSPPWNRCSADTGHCLVDLGFRALSRDVTAEPLGLSRLQEVPVRVDWFAKHKGVRLSREELGRRVAEGLGSREPFGLMLHHAEMDAGEREAAGELLSLMSGSDRVIPVRMGELLDGAGGAGG